MNRTLPLLTTLLFANTAWANCAAISDKTIRAECEAYVKVSTSSCSRISDDELKAACSSVVGLLKKGPDYARSCATQRPLTTDSMKRLDMVDWCEAIVSQDVGRCRDISDSTRRGYCDNVIDAMGGGIVAPVRVEAPEPTGTSFCSIPWRDAVDSWVASASSWDARMWEATEFRDGAFTFCGYWTAKTEPSAQFLSALKTKAPTQWRAFDQSSANDG